MARVFFLAFVMLGACGDNETASFVDAAPPPPDADTRDILVRLQALPGITAVERTPKHAPPGYRYFTLHITQPVDHDAAPGGASFQQEVSLLHRDLGAPMIAATSGYEEGYRDYAADLTTMLGANQVSIEHRYFGESIPAAPVDWTKLTIAQMAADEHAIVTALSTIYRGNPWVATGGSKGGMTATFYHRFYPGDLAGSVAYVAPLSFAIPDDRYLPQFTTIGTSACRAQIKNLATELLDKRRAAMEARAQAQADMYGYSYTRIALKPAVESAILDLEWTYWQYYGLASCNQLPAVTADDDTLFAFLDNYSPIGFSEDNTTATFEAYFYQAYWQLGSPGLAQVRGDALPTQLASLAAYGPADFAGTLPQGTPVPLYDPAPMIDIDHWVKTEGSHLIFVYGQLDPWTSGAFALGSGTTDAMKAVVPGGTHGSGILDLVGPDRTAALAKLAAWTGVTPVVPSRTKYERPPLRRHPL